MRKITALAVPNLGIIEAGANLPSLIFNACREAGISLEDFDIVVLAQKIVSKAEGRTVDLRRLKVSPRASRIAERVGKSKGLTEAILRESRGVVRLVKGHLIVAHNLGIVLANAGVDRSNASSKEGVVTLLPKDPDLSARRVRQGLMALSRLKELGVIIADSVGRPFRQGSVGIAVGVAGLSPLKDYRGRKDLYGRILRTSIEAIGDEIASLANLLMGQGDEGRPVVIVRGLKWEGSEGSAKELIRDKKKDLFR